MIALFAGALRWIFFTAVLAVAVHFATILYLPNLLMSRALERLSSTTGFNRMAFPDRAGPEIRALSRPNPDYLVALCVFDLTQTNLRVHVAPPADGSWSITLYGEDSAPFAFINALPEGASSWDKLLVGPGAIVGGADQTASLMTPAFRGVLMFRVLIDDPAKLAERDAARHQASCESVSR